MERNSKSRREIRAKGVGSFFLLKMVILNYLEINGKSERLFGKRDLRRNINYDLLKNSSFGEITVNEEGNSSSPVGAGNC